MQKIFTDPNSFISGVFCPETTHYPTRNRDTVEPVFTKMSLHHPNDTVTSFREVASGEWISLEGDLKIVARQVYKIVEGRGSTEATL